MIETQQDYTTAGSPPPAPNVDAKRLAADLKGRLDGEVRFDDGSRALYATDGSNYRQVPIGVVIPKNLDDVRRTIELCRTYDAPVLSRGGGTSLAGQCCNVAVVIDWSKYLNQILELDLDGRSARVQPGTILDDLKHETEKDELTFGPDPATHNHCTFGGMIGNNSCGIHSVMAGRTADNIKRLKVLTYDGLELTVGRTSDEELAEIIAHGGPKGEIYRRMRDLRDKYADLIRAKYPPIPRRVSGYNLYELLPERGFHVARALVGSEGTLVTILEAEVELIHSPPARTLVVLGYPDIYEAGQHVPEIMEHEPIGLEGIDDRLAQYMHKKGLHVHDLELLPDGGGWLLVEFGGDDKDESDGRAREMMDALRGADHPPNMELYDDPAREELVWEVRESGLGATARVPGMKDTWPGWEDAAVPPQRVGDYLADFRKLLDKYGYGCALYGHFGQGCIHTRIDFDLRTHDGIATYRDFIEEASDLVMAYDGSFSGEHGDGQARAALLPKMFGGELMEALREFKRIWDPRNKMNPGKVIDPYDPTENLRLGTDYRPWEPETHFKLPDDDGSFARAALRCVGVGKCRRLGEGTMCPSFMATREEKDSTRGRARLLFEMMQQDVIGQDGWREDAVFDALELCLACKGCKSDCPVNVDMATYKAEFLSHYYEHRLRPIQAYSMGMIQKMAPLGALWPALTNFVTHAPGLATLFKWAGGIAYERDIPRFAEEPFRKWFARRPSQNDGAPKVLLWPDTFNNYFFPNTAKAAVTVLEAAGFQVILPKQRLCCGRPLYDYGFLDQAKGHLRNILAHLREEIEQGIPLVGLEPSCTAVFRDELPNMLPNDEDAKRLENKTFLLSEFLINEVEDYQPPQLDRRALVHGHCHQKAVLSLDTDKEVLRRMGVEFEVLDSGCCGMAGSFGFERGEKYEVSMKCGERVLLPAVRGRERDTLIITDGFSCREQIRQGANHNPHHLAEVLELALRTDK